MKVVNALDHREVAMIVFNESTTLPEFLTDKPDSFTPLLPPALPPDPSDESEHWFAHTVDIWPEIKKLLTQREYQVFEYTYRFQMNCNDIVEIMGIRDKSVYKLLSKAKVKIQKAFGNR